MTSDFLGPITEILCICSDSCVLDSFPESFQWVSLFLEASWSRVSLNFDSDFVLDPSLPDTNRGNHFLQHHYEWNALFFTENRVCRPPNTVYQHPGQQYPKCEWVCVRSGLTDNWTTSSIYNARARPILSFPRSKTEKYSLWKTSPRIQFSVDELTLFSSKVVQQWPLESWGHRDTHQVSMSPYWWLSPISRPSTILCFISLFW